MTGGNNNDDTFRSRGARKKPFPMNDDDDDDNEEEDIFKFLESSVELTVDESDGGTVCSVPPLPDNNNNNNHSGTNYHGGGGEILMIDAAATTTSNHTNHSQSSISSSVVELSRIPPLLIPQQNRSWEVQPGAYHHGGIDDTEGDIDIHILDEGDNDLDHVLQQQRHYRSSDELDMISLLNLSGMFFSDETIVSAVLVEDDDNEAPSNSRSNNNNRTSSIIEPLEATMLVQAIVLDERKRCFRQLRGILQFCILVAILLMIVFFLVSLWFGVPVLTFVEESKKKTVFIEPSSTTEPPHNILIETDVTFNDDTTVVVKEMMTDKPSEQLDDTDSVEEMMTNEPSEQLDEQTVREPEIIVDEPLSKEGTDGTLEESVEMNHPSNVEKGLDVSEGHAQETPVMIKAPTRRYSYHVLNWGSGTYCDSFDKGNITVSCGSNGVIDEWENLSGHCESVDAHSLHCIHERSRYESNSTILFSCMGSSDEDLYATAHHDSSRMSDCRVVANPLFAPKVTGVSTNYLSLGRFCHGGSTAGGGLSLKDNYQCHGGKIKSIYMNNATVVDQDLSNFRNIDQDDYLAVDVGVSDENWQTFCYSEVSCELPFRACGANLSTFFVENREPSSSTACGFAEYARPGFDQLKTITIEQKCMGVIFIYDFWSSSYHRIWT